jgi:hypothetical protein
MITLSGRCYCSNLQIRFETDFNHTNLPLHACQCGFCRAHGAVTVADPDGRVFINANDSRNIRHYRFGLGITDFLICADCGVFVSAMMEIDGRHYASININILGDRVHLQMSPQPVDYANESAEQRRARRKINWTPAIITGKLD